MNQEELSASSLEIHTFGCKVNTYDTGLLQKRLASAGLLSGEQGASLHVINTCAVTAQATREAQRRVRKIKSQNPLATVVVTGCAAQVDTDKFSQMSGVDLVVANSHKGDLENIIRRHLLGEDRTRIFKSNIFKKTDLEVGGGVEKRHTRTFLKVQDGCNSFCTYCVIPFARGKSRSIPIKELVERVNTLSQEGVREVVITGIHIGDYADGGNGLEDLVEGLLQKTTMPRFRISSLEPPEVSDRLLQLYQDPRMCPHFHMSIQSCSDSILKDMKREYPYRKVEERLNAIVEQVPDVFIGMDIIVGFPGESDEFFSETYWHLQELPWSRLHVFPYSERQGTYAVRLENKIPGDVIARRAKALREISNERYRKKIELQVGQVKSAIALKTGQLLTKDNWTVRTRTPVKTGEIYRVKITGYDPSTLERPHAQLIAALVEQT